MKDNLNKKILFISPEFFGIDKIIMHVLEEKGASVSWLNERSVTSAFCRALNAVNPYFFYYQSNRYYRKSIEKLNETFDIVFVIKGDMVTKETISFFKRKNPNAKIILYLYDPVRYIKGILPKISLYDKVISFEPDDCEKYGFEFRPLFCDFKKDSNKKNAVQKKYNICFYGTMYGDRFDIVQQAKVFCEKNNIKFYSFCFLRGKFMALYYWIKSKAFRKLGVDAISFTPKNSDEISDIISSSDIILDTNDVYQGGLTLRTLETLVSGKKMITTNSNIEKYDFYNPKNIYVIDRKKIFIPQDFLKTEYEPVDPAILERYTAEGWVHDVFIK
ncbi:MAG: capsular biosynthesis protein CpsH [Clostridium sp.]